MLTEEKKLQKKIIKELQDLGAYVVKTITVSKNGVPDIICCLNGFFLAIEVKGDTNSATKLQEFNINQIKKAKGEAFCVNDFSQVLEIIAKIEKKGIEN
jgi:Holliday junction resolvase